jgi:hypothetical protein
VAKLSPGKQVLLVRTAPKRRELQLLKRGCVYMVQWPKTARHATALKSRALAHAMGYRLKPDAAVCAWCFGKHAAMHYACALPRHRRPVAHCDAILVLKELRPRKGADRCFQSSEASGNLHVCIGSCVSRYICYKRTALLLA